MKLAILVGNVGSKPVIKESNGTTYTNFSVAVNDRDRQGEPITEWYRVVAFRKLAETLRQVETGDELLVHGTFHQTSYTGKDEVQHRDVEIRAWTIKFLRRKDRGQPDESQAAYPGEPADRDVGDDLPDLSEPADGPFDAAPGDAASRSHRRTRAA